ncbi:MAG: hypothetical protein KKB20_23880 [Proteobacteria bacterium]|nr:hypothetical protein [Pseudomonadota bacterium]
MTEPHLTDMDKLAHLLEHWREHNDEHAANYESWADKAARAGHKETAALLRQAAQATQQISDLFSRAKKAIK